MSFGARGIMTSRDLIRNEACFLVGCGRDECGIPVNSLLSSDTSSWRPEMVRRLFCPALSDMVWSFPRLFPNLPNELIWKASKDGSFSFKEAYLALVRGWCGEEDDMWRLIWKNFNRFLVMTPPAPFASRMRTPPTTYSSIAKLPRRFGDLALGEFVLMLWFFLTTRLLYDGSYLRQTFLLLMQRTGQGSSCMLLWCAFIFGGVVEDNRSHTPAGVDLVSGSNTRQHTWNDINLFMDAAVLEALTKRHEVSSALEVELVAIQEACILIAHRGFINTSVFSDCQVVIAGLTARRSPDWKARQCFDQSLQAFSDVPNSCLVWIPRRLNVAGHDLAA
ncbi:hypothetical protein F8388_001274 [Cannabis sativa]|uniref:RNase H type-1 domain-containing protein n=1 Tax=Cannabis sativa TaxID=3483 RepID=A0A7J6G8Y1_CANSA|nr:hypothetical protein F8388_001274 [Cannabis sativa]